MKGQLTMLQYDSCLLAGMYRVKADGTQTSICTVKSIFPFSRTLQLNERTIIKVAYEGLATIDPHRQHIASEMCSQRYMLTYSLPYGSRCGTGS
jgi:hypothetical protein